MFSVLFNGDEQSISYVIAKISKFKKTIYSNGDFLIDYGVKMSFVYKKNKFHVKTWRSEEIVGTQRLPDFMTYLELSSSKRESVENFVKEANEIYNKDHYFKENHIQIWIPDNHGYWDFYSNLNIRDVDSVILDKGIKEDIIEDVVQFDKNEKEYGKYGMPYKRVYCIYGPPGTGKSSIIFTIASYFKLNIAMINFGSGVTDDIFLKLMSNIPENTILLLEDIDALFESRTAVSKTEEGFLSFSTLLNTLDGNLRIHGLKTFMTTNHPEKLDHALLRKGRIDYMANIDYISKYQIEEFAKLYYPKLSKKELNEFVSIISKIKKLSSSRLSNFLFLHRDLSFDEIMELIKTQKKLI